MGTTWQSCDSDPVLSGPLFRLVCAVTCEKNRDLRCVAAVIGDEVLLLVSFKVWQCGVMLPLGACCMEVVFAAGSVH